MSFKEIADRPGWYLVVVYDKVRTPGERPRKTQRIVKGQRAAAAVDRELTNERERGSLRDRRESLSGYCARYLESRRAEVSRQTLQGYERAVRQYIDRHDIGRVPVGDITPTAVRHFYAALLERGSRGRPISTETIRGVHRVLSMILSHAAEDGLLRTNPCRRAKPPKDNRAGEDEREPGVDPEIAGAFVAAAQGTPIGAIAAVALGTGLRKSELLGLRWSDVDLRVGELHVTGKIEQVKDSVERLAPKSRRSRRTVPFAKKVGDVLREQVWQIGKVRRELKGHDRHGAPLWVEEDWVFPCLHVSETKTGQILPAGRIWTPSAFAQEWRRAKDRIDGIRLGEYVLAREPIDSEDALAAVVSEFDPSDFGIHALRHAYGTIQLATRAAPLETVSRRMGHSSSAVTLRIYSHVLKSQEREGVEAADDLLPDLSPQRPSAV